MHDFISDHEVTLLVDMIFVYFQYEIKKKKKTTIIAHVDHDVQEHYYHSPGHATLSPSTVGVHQTIHASNTKREKQAHALLRFWSVIRVTP